MARLIVISNRVNALAEGAGSVGGLATALSAALREYSGAWFGWSAERMREALIVNPFSREKVSDAIRRALAMGVEERRRRWESLVHEVRVEDVTVWRDRFVAALHSAGSTPPLELVEPDI